ncbi:MAG: carbohydrate ABC transporter permease [Oscillospiraceae bacterium]|jgi:multiple sugar transport system permease protein|nr:carbohydrate ABC transporter permease [Oscillospiraceae bacterium]
MNHRLRRFLLGNNERSGFLNRFVIYFVLIGLGFVYIYPVLYMLTTSLMNTRDLVDATVTWIPRQLSAEGFRKASATLNFWPRLRDSVVMSVLPALLQTASLAISGYGLARFRVPLKGMWFAFIILVFLIPSAVTLIPRYMLFNGYHLVGTAWPSFLTAALGQGVKSSVFLLVYYQFFGAYPKALDEAAQIDGASVVRVFLRIALPMAIPAIVVTFLFSFIWLWNETTQLSLLSGTAINTLPMALEAFTESFDKLYPANDVSAGGALNESIRMAGTLLSIAPLMAVYLCLQKTFIQSVERSGITGE